MPVNLVLPEIRRRSLYQMLLMARLCMLYLIMSALLRLLSQVVILTSKSTCYKMGTYTKSNKESLQFKFNQNRWLISYSRLTTLLSLSPWLLLLLLATSELFNQKHRLNWVSMMLYRFSRIPIQSVESSSAPTLSRGIALWQIKFYFWRM